MTFATRELPENFDAIAPDGSEVRILATLRGGGFAHFTLASGEVSIAAHHRTVEEIWFVLGGHGEMWRADGEASEVTPLAAGTCITIPLGTRFQFRSSGPDALTIVAATMPPWPGDGEAVRVNGPWEPTLAPGPGFAESTD